MEYMIRRDPITGFFENVLIPDVEEVEEEIVAQPIEVVVESPKKVGRPRGVKHGANGSRTHN